MVLGGNNLNAELEAMVRKIIEEQVDHDKRLERLESLEFHKARDGLGCITFEDYDQGAQNIFTVNRTSVAFPNYASTHLTCWFDFDDNNDTTLWMQINNYVDAQYDYAGSYTKGGVTTDFSAGGATAFRVADLWASGGPTQTIGRVDIPLWPFTLRPHFISEWASWDYSDEAANRVSRGNVGGFYRVSRARPAELDFFITGGGAFSGHFYLYSWCPEITPGGGPPD